MNYIPRIIEPSVLSTLQSKNPQVVIIIGQRQTGKTSLLRHLETQVKQSTWVDFEDLGQRDLFKPSVTLLQEWLRSAQNPKWLFLDEIQCLPQAGTILKLLHDHIPTLNIIATGSASFLLLKNVGDSLYGRCKLFTLHPLTLREILGKPKDAHFSLGQENYIAFKPSILAKIPDLLVYGSLPQVWCLPDKTEKRVLLKNYVNSLLFKDVFELEGIRHPQTFIKLLKLLALQLGSEVNSNELAKGLGIDRKTVLEYIHLYEKFCIIYTLTPFSSNLRKELLKGFKVYFTDLGVRNAVIDNHIPCENRTDVGALFENLVINQIKAQIEYFQRPYQLYFWRTYAQAEVDLVLAGVESTELIPIEIKWNRATPLSKSFKESYQPRIEQTFCITRDNLYQFV